MSGNKNMRILRHMIQYCDQITEAMVLFGKNYDIFKSNNTYRNACCLCLLQIGELTYSLTDDFKISHSGVPWKQIRGFRNIIAHAYGTIEPAVVWDILMNDLPTLKSYCQKCLKDIENSPPPISID